MSASGEMWTPGISMYRVLLRLYKIKIDITVEIEKNEFFNKFLNNMIQLIKGGLTQSKQYSV